MRLFELCDGEMSTLKGVEDGEDVEGGQEQRSVTEESKSPGDAEQVEQAEDGEGFPPDGADVLPFLSCDL